MRIATRPSNSGPRRCSRRLRRRRRSSQPQLFMLYNISVAAVIALFVAFDAEAMHPHHHHHRYADGQVYARGGESRANPTERLRGAGQPGSPWSSAAAAGAGSASGSSIPASQPCGRVEGQTAGAGNDYRPPRHDAAAAHPPLPAFVAAPVARRRRQQQPAAGITGWHGQRPPPAALESTRRFSSMTRQQQQHQTTQPTQQEQQQQQQRPLRIPTAGQGNPAGAGWPRPDAFYSASYPSDAAPRCSSFAGVDGDSHAGGYSRQGYASWFGAGPTTQAREDISSSKSRSIRSRNSEVLVGASGGSVEGGRGAGMMGREGMDGQDRMENRRPPMLVTIGPQCAGKTSLLRKLAERGEAAREREGEEAGAGVGAVVDVSIDDQPSVYHTIPTDLLLGGCARGSREDVPVARRPLSERLQDAGCLEARFVALRLSGHISAQEMADRLQGYGGQASPQALAALRSAVENAVSEDVRVCTPTVDIFIREGLFPAAVTFSQEKLAAAARDTEGMVAWGNTNTQARDYRAALAQAELTGRPVRFLRWGHELPLLSLDELSRRNVCRFAATGRYIETAAVESALARVNKLYASTSGGDPSSLALAAGFEMDAYGGVRSTTSSPPTSRRQQRQNQHRRSDDSRSRAMGGGRGGSDRRRHRGEGPQAGGGATGNRFSSGGNDVRGPEAFYSGGGMKRAADNSVEWGRSSGSSTAGFYRTSGGGGGGGGGDGHRRADQADRWQVAPPDNQLTQQPPPPPPPMAQPLPAGPGRLTFDGADGRRYENPAAATAPLGMAQGWSPRGGDDARGLVVGATGGSSSSSSRRWDYSDGGGGGGGGGGAPPTVMFGNEWGRKRAWRRTGYTDDDIDPSMSSCFFRTPANSTGTLRRNDLGEGMGADLEEMELVRRIRSFRQRR